MNNEKILKNVKLRLAAYNFDKTKKEKKNTVLLKCAAVCLIVTSFVGITNANKIKYYVDDIFGDKRTTKQGIQSALDNGYVSFPDMEYKKSLNGMQVGIEAFIIDDFTFAITFDVIVPEEYNVGKDNTGIYFENIEVLDEENKKIVDLDDNATGGTGGAMGEYGYLGYSIQPEKIEENKYKIYYEFTGKFDKVQKLKIILDGVVTRNAKNDTKEKHDDKFEFILQVPEVMYSRNKTLRVKSCSDDTTKITNARISSTECYIEYETLRYIIYGGEYFTTEDGKVFGASRGHYGQTSYPNYPTEEKPIERVAPYAITIYDVTGVITYHIPTKDGQEITIEFELDNVK